MLCLLALLGALPPSSKYSKLKVFSKLSGKYLGVVDKPSFQDGDQLSDYQVIRDLQDQIAVFYKHARRPARYLVVFAKGVRLTCQGFYFTSKESYKQSCATSTSNLEHASRVDVMYDEDDEFALQTLRYRGFGVYFDNNTVEVDNTHGTRMLLQPEMQVFEFRNVTKLKLKYIAQELGPTNLFDFVQSLEIGAYGELELADFDALAKLKNVTFLYLRACAFLRNSMAPIGNMTKLEHLTVVMTYKSRYLRDDNSVCLPASLGRLLNLKTLVVWGYAWHGVVPTELGMLGVLENLSLMSCPRLTGKLPKELNNIPSLKRINLGDSNVDVNNTMLGGVWNCGVWTNKKWSSE